MSRSRKVLLVIAAAAVLLVTTPWLWIRWMESRRWAHLERRVDEIAREIESLIPPHRPLRGESIPGDAWDDYLEACRQVEGQFYWYDPSPLTDRAVGMEDTIQLYSPYYPALELLRRGTRRAQIRRARVHEGSTIFNWERHNQALGGAGGLTQVGRTRARQLWRDGRPTETAELLLDLCRFGHDVLRDGSGRAAFTGARIADEALVDLQDLICFAGTPAPLLEQIDRELKLLDDSFPTRAGAFLGDLEQFGRGLLKDGWQEEFGKLIAAPGLGDWRIGWSCRLQMTSAFDEADGTVARIRNLDTLTAADEALVWEKVRYDPIAPYTTYRQVYWVLMWDGIPLHRHHRTRLRLLRTAVHHRATGEVVHLDDPLGTKLIHQLDPDVLRVSSVGRNLSVEVPRR